MNMRIGLIIPARDEQYAVGTVVGGCRECCASLGTLRVVVCDNGSTDGTANAARAAGAEVVHEQRPGYGAACLRALAHLSDWPDVIVFVDGDGSSDPRDIPSVVTPVLQRQADLVIGHRRRIEPGSMTLPQRFGNRLACSLIRWRWGRRYGDCGPLRAIGRAALGRLSMTDQTWGWNVEMQIKAIVHGLVIHEVPVSWLRRVAGKSKISGTISGVLRAGSRILWTCGKLAVRRSAVVHDPRAIVIAFVKHPQAGEVKTRLAQSIGPQQAAQVYARMAEATHRELVNLQDSGTIHAALAVSGASIDRFQEWLPGARHYWPQTGADLGARLKAASSRAFQLGANQVAVIGTDCPGMSAPVVRDALARLDDADVVIVPATDGGYALLASGRFHPELFEEIDWSTSRVLEQTLARADTSYLKVVQLAALSDIDTIDDLIHFDSPATAPGIDSILKVQE